MEQNVSLRQVLLEAFPGIKPEQVDDVIQSGQINNYPAGKILCHEAALESVFYIILSGQVQVTKRVHVSEERTLQILGEGGFFGEMAILHDAPRAATVVTTMPTTVLEIYKDSFTGMIEGNNSISLAIVREVSRRLRENEEMAIEDLRLKAKELASAYQQLAEEEYARSQFLTTVAHELRTPLMAANGYLHAVRTGMVQGERLTSAMDTIWRNLQEVTTLTNDLLFLQEMELILPEFRPIDLAAVVKAAIEQEKGMANQIGVQIHLDLATDLPNILGDPKSLQRALAAILDNAIKFSPDGGDVDVTVRFIESTIEVIIRDHGVGIPPEAMPRIFQRFFHLDVICGRVFRGIGLGLAVARQVIEQHRGAIEVQSQLEKGSTFTVRLQV